MKPWILAATAALVLVITASVLFAHKPAPAPELSFSTLQGQSFVPPTCAARWCW